MKESTSFIRKFLRLLKRIWIISAIRRFYIAIQYHNYRYKQIFSWVFRSKEFTNFTYEITNTNKLYFAHAISLVTGNNVDDVLALFKELEEDLTLKEHIQKIIQKSEERHYADKTIYFGRRMVWYAFVRILKPNIVIETGVDKGLGSVVLCSALLRNMEEGYKGHYFGTDINPKAGYLLTEGYSSVGEILYGDSLASLKKFDRKIDIFINDSDHSSDYERREYETIINNISKDGVIISDNAHVSDQLAKFALEIEKKFVFLPEEPSNHWYPGGGVGIAF